MLDKYEQECIDIYMSVHVSQLYNVCDDTKKKWIRGQEIYDLQIQNGERIAFLNQE